MRRVLISTKPFIFVLFLVGVTVRSAESLSSTIPLDTSTKRANSKRANHGRLRLFQDAVSSVSFWLRSFPVCGWQTWLLSSVCGLPTRWRCVRGWLMCLLWAYEPDFVVISPFLSERIGTLCCHPCWSLWLEQRIAGWHSGRSEGDSKSLSTRYVPTDLLLLTQRTSHPVPRWFRWSVPRGAQHFIWSAICRQDVDRSIGGWVHILWGWRCGLRADGHACPGSREYRAGGPDRAHFHQTGRGHPGVFGKRRVPCVRAGLFSCCLENPAWIRAQGSHHTLPRSGGEPASTALGGGRSRLSVAVSHKSIAHIRGPHPELQKLWAALCLPRRSAEREGCLQTEAGPLDSGGRRLGVPISRRAVPPGGEDSLHSTVSALSQFLPMCWVTGKWAGRTGRCHACCAIPSHPGIRAPFFSSRSCHKVMPLNATRSWRGSACGAFHRIPMSSRHNS